MGGNDPLERLAGLADELGPALVPPGHEELLESIVETARSLFGAAACSIALLEGGETDEPKLAFLVAVGRGAETVIDLKVPATEGIAGFVLRSGQPLVIDDVSTDPRFSRATAGETGYVPTAIVALPLETERGTIGVLEVLDPDTGSLGTARGMELLGHFAMLAALSIEGASVFRNLGRMLFEAAAGATDDRDAGLAEALREAGTRRRRDADLSDLASIFVELRRLGPEERKAATSMLLTFLRYAGAARGASS